MKVSYMVFVKPNRKMSLLSYSFPCIHYFLAKYITKNNAGIGEVASFTICITLSIVYSPVLKVIVSCGKTIFV